MNACIAEADAGDGSSKVHRRPCFSVIRPQNCTEQRQSITQVKTHWTLPITYRHIRVAALCPGLPGWAGTRKVIPIWTLLKQETVSGSGIIWAMCKSVPRSRQITTPAPHHSVFYRPDAQPKASKHWRQSPINNTGEREVTTRLQLRILHSSGESAW